MESRDEMRLQAAAGLFEELSGFSLMSRSVLGAMARQFLETTPGCDELATASVVRSGLVNLTQYREKTPQPIAQQLVRMVQTGADEGRISMEFAVRLLGKVQASADYAEQLEIAAAVLREPDVLVKMLPPEAVAKLLGKPFVEPESAEAVEDEQEAARRWPATVGNITPESVAERQREAAIQEHEPVVVMVQTSSSQVVIRSWLGWVTNSPTNGQLLVTERDGAEYVFQLDSVRRYVISRDTGEDVVNG